MIGGVNFAAGGGLQVQMPPVAWVALAALLGLGALAVAEGRELQRGKCCGTGNVPQVIPKDLCLQQFPAKCCPAVT